MNHFNPVKAKENYCVPAVIEMMLKSFGIKDISQDDIADELCNLTGQSFQSFFENGLRLTNTTLNEFFRRRHLALREEFISYSVLRDEYEFEETIRLYLEKDKFLICGYKYSWLYEDCSKDIQHVSIICDINTYDETLQIFDPGPYGFGLKKVSLDKLWCAVKAARDGIWIISTISA